LALVGQYTKLLGTNALVDRKFPVAVGGIPNNDILEFYLGLLVQGKYTTGPVDFCALACGYMAVDWGTFVMSNSGTQEEAVGRTYQGVNILRLVGQNALIGEDAPLRHAAKRRRTKTVMQDIICKAGRMIKHARRWVLGPGANDSAHTVFERL
jgi:hypothetical protein